MSDVEVSGNEVSSNVTVDLMVGYTDARGLRHTRVVFGKRLTGKDLFRIDSDPQSEITTQYQDLIMRASIVEFGTMTMPVPLRALLSLDSIDRDDLAAAHHRFSMTSIDGRQPEIESDTRVLMIVGYELNGLTYDVVEFGRRLTGMDEVEADKRGYKLGSIKRVCFLAGQQVSRLLQSNGASELKGPIGLEVFEKLDALDLQALRLGSEVYRNSFRGTRTALPSNGGSPHGVPDSPRDRLVRA